jgi:hypothetical protein
MFPIDSYQALADSTFASGVSAKKTPVPKVYSNLESEEERRRIPGIRED